MDLGKIGYDEFVAVHDAGSQFRHPTWEEAPELVRNCWTSAAEKIKAVLTGGGSEVSPAESADKKPPKKASDKEVESEKEPEKVPDVPPEPKPEDTGTVEQPNVDDGAPVLPNRS